MTAPGGDPTDRRFVDEEDLLDRVPPDSGQHDAVLVAAAGRAAWIDTTIAELIYLCWRLGIATDGSCGALDDERGTWVSVDFPTLAAADLFYRYALPPVEALSEEVAMRLCDPDSPDGWRGVVSPPYYLDRMAAGVALTFPAADLAWVTARLRAVHTVLTESGR